MFDLRKIFAGLKDFLKSKNYCTVFRKANNRCILICSSSPRKEWDFYVFAPNGQRFRSTVEITKYVENNPNVECDLEVTNTFRPENFQKSSSPMKRGRPMKKYNGAKYLGFFSSRSLKTRKKMN